MRALFFFLIMLSLPGLDISSAMADALCHVLVVGSTPGGVAAAIASARFGRDTCLISDTPFMGGQLVAIGSFDGGGSLLANSDGLFGEIKTRIKAQHPEYGNPQYRSCVVSDVCFSPRKMSDLLRTMVLDAGVTVVHTDPDFLSRVLMQGDTVRGIELKDGEKWLADVTIDATEFGDILDGAGAQYRLGCENEAGFSEPDFSTVCPSLDLFTGQPLALLDRDKVQAPTWTVMMKHIGDPMPMAQPEGYYEWRYRDFASAGWRWTDGEPRSADNTVPQYLMLPDESTILNWPLYGNGFPGINLADMPPAVRASGIDALKKHSLQFAYHINKLHPTWVVRSDETEITGALYNRESRRGVGQETLTEFDLIKGGDEKRKRLREDAITFIDHSIDLWSFMPEPCAAGCDQSRISGGLPGRHEPSNRTGSLHRADTLHASVPIGVLIPAKLDGLLFAEKNISVSRLANGAARFAPAAVRIGEAAGVLAALASTRGVQPRYVSAREVQDMLLERRHALYFFNDITTDHPFFSHLQRLVRAGVLVGLPGETIRPDALLTRAESAVYLIKSLVVTGRLPGDFTYASTPYFSDVPVEHWAFRYVQKMKELGITSGCAADSFCPDAYVTRAQAAVFIERSRQALVTDCSGTAFADVNVFTVGRGFCAFIESLSRDRITSGCQADDASTPELEARFCPHYPMTRGTMAVFVDRAMFR